MTRHTAAWLEQILNLCAGADVRHVDVIFDQAGWSLSVLPAAASMQPPMPWYSLFTGTPEESLVDDAPILLRFALDDWAQKLWLEELLAEVAPLSRVMVLITPLPFEALAHRLGELVQFSWNEQSGLLRYFDPRVLSPLLQHVLNDQQRERFARLAMAWTWLDRDQQPAWQSGAGPGGALPCVEPSIMVFTDAQMDRLGCIGDAQTIIGMIFRDFPELTLEACFARGYRFACKVSEEGSCRRLADCYKALGLG